MFSITTLPFAQMLLTVVEVAGNNSCRVDNPTELIAIIAVMAGLLSFAATVSASAITLSVPAIAIAIPTAVAKILGVLAIGVTWTSIIVPLDPFLDIAAVAAAVESIKHILGCG